MNKWTNQSAVANDNDLPNETRAGTAPWSNQNDTHDTITNMQHGM